MHHTVWKLTALSGVVGIGLLVVMQAQRGLLPKKDAPPEGDRQAQVADTQPASRLTNGDSGLPAQHEPLGGPESFSLDREPVPADEKNISVTEARSRLQNRLLRTTPAGDRDPFQDDLTPLDDNSRPAVAQTEPPTERRLPTMSFPAPLSSPNDLPEHDAPIRDNVTAVRSRTLQVAATEPAEDKGSDPAVEDASLQLRPLGTGNPTSAPPKGSPAQAARESRPAPAPLKPLSTPVDEESLDSEPATPRKNLPALNETDVPEDLFSTPKKPAAAPQRPNTLKPGTGEAAESEGDDPFDQPTRPRAEPRPARGPSPSAGTGKPPLDDESFTPTPTATQPQPLRNDVPDSFQPAVPPRTTRSTPAAAAPKAAADPFETPAASGAAGNRDTTGNRDEDNPPLIPSRVSTGLNAVKRGSSVRLDLPSATTDDQDPSAFPSPAATSRTQPATTVAPQEPLGTQPRPETSSSPSASSPTSTLPNASSANTPPTQPRLPDDEPFSPDTPGERRTPSAAGGGTGSGTGIRPGTSRIATDPFSGSTDPFGDDRSGGNPAADRSPRTSPNPSAPGSSPATTSSPSSSSSPTAVPRTSGTPRVGLGSALADEGITPDQPAERTSPARAPTERIPTDIYAPNSAAGSASSTNPSGEANPPASSRGTLTPIMPRQPAASASSVDRTYPERSSSDNAGVSRPDFSRPDSGRTDSGRTEYQSRPERIATLPERSVSVREDLPAGERMMARGAQRPHLTIEKVAPENAVVGSAMVYDIYVKNAGSSPAHQVVVEDRIPSGVELKGTIPQAEAAGNRLIWRMGTIDPGKEKKISVRVVPQSEGTIGSVATVSFASEVGAQTIITAPRLQFTMTGQSPVTVGSQVLFGFRVVNSGRVKASRVVIRNVLPAGLKHADGDDLEYEIGDLPPGAKREIQLALTAAQQGRLVNRAVVTAQGGISIESEAVIEVLGPSLTVSRMGPKRLLLGKSGTFVNTVSNNGNLPVKEITIVETLPPGMDFVSANSDGRFDTRKRTVTWRIDRIEPGQSKRIEATLSSVSRGAQVSVVRATDGQGASGEAVGTTNVSGVAALSIELGELAPVYEVGERVNCRVRVLNRGNDAADHVRTTVILPPGLQLISAKSQGNYQKSGDQLQFEAVSRLDARQEQVIDLVLQAIRSGEVRLEVQSQSDQMSQPIRREEVTTITTPQE